MRWFVGLVLILAGWTSSIVETWTIEMTLPL